MRLHGRNAEAWWCHQKPEDRYDYLYSTDELREFSDTAGAAKQLVKKVYLYTNNHFSAKSVANAAMIQAAAWRAGRGCVPAGIHRALSRTGRSGLDHFFAVHSFDDVAALNTGHDVVAGDDVTDDCVLPVQVWSVGERGRRPGYPPARVAPACAIATVPFEWVRFLLISDTPIGLPLDAVAPRPHSACFPRSRDRGSPHWMTKPGNVR